MNLIDRIDVAANLLALSEGEELTISGEVWFRISPSEFKVSPHAPDYDRDCYWVPATTMDIVAVLPRS